MLIGNQLRFYLSIFFITIAFLTTLSTSSRINEPSSKCGELREGYQEVPLTSLSAELEGQKIMVTSTIQYSPRVACTYMMCHPDHPCCNTCRSSLTFEGITLTASDGVDFGCLGDDCKLKCTYDEEELVTVYGEISSDGNFILVEDSCSHSIEENE